MAAILEVEFGCRQHGSVNVLCHSETDVILTKIGKTSQKLYIVLGWQALCLFASV